MRNSNLLIDELHFGFRTNNISSELINSIVDLTKNGNFTAAWHPVAGFIYLNIGSRGSYNYRFHIWHPNGTKIYKYYSWPIIHQHRWTLNSYVVKGEIVNDIYEVNNSPDHPTHSLYRVEHKSSEDRFLPCNENVTVALNSSTHYLTGQFYEVRTNQFHSTKHANESIGATLIQTNSISSKSKVVGPLSGVIHPMIRVACSKSDLEYYLELLRKSL